MEGITQWEVVTVIVVLIGLVGTLYSGASKFTQPIQELKESTIKLNIALETLNEAINRIDSETREQKEYTLREFTEISIRLNKHRDLIQQVFRFLELEEEQKIDE